MTDPSDPTNEPSPSRGPEPADLGAAAPISAPARTRPDKGGSRSGRGLGKKLGAIVVVAILLALVPLAYSSLEKTPRDKVGISYGGGPFEGEHFQKIVEPGSSLFFNGLFDRLFLYPADQQNYIVPDPSAGEGDEAEPIYAPTSDRVQVSFDVAVYYRLDTDRLQAFHEEFGLRYQAFTSSGWDRLINDTLRPQIVNALQEETRRQTVQDLYGDAELLLEIQEGIQATLSERLEAAMGDRYFCAPTFEPGGECGDPTFVIKRVGIPESVAAAFEQNRTSAIEVTTKENEVAQRENEARAIEALGLDDAAYVLLKAIESGQIEFWVIPENGEVTLDSAGVGGEEGGP